MAEVNVEHLHGVYERLGSFYTGDLTTNESVSEFCEFRPELWWCSDILCSLAYDYTTGVYHENPSDEHVVQEYRDFLEKRLLVARYHAKQVAAKDDYKDQKTKNVACDRANKFLDYARKSLSWANINAGVSLWKKVKYIASTEINQNKNLMGTPVGVFNIDGDLLKTEEEYMTVRNWELCQEETMSVGEGLYVTKSTRGRIDNTFYDYQLQQDLKPDMRWYRFIDEITCGDKELGAYIQRALGYSAFVAGNPEECMFLAHGASTRNGKSTLLNSVQYALGDYATSASNDFLLKKKFSSQGDKDELALLQGTHLLIISEPPLGEEIDESKAKSYTGNDVITTSKKYGHTFSFAPQFTMWVMSNSLPVIKDVSLVTSERIQVVPFERHFTKAEQDPNLKARFQTERGMYTILSWLHKGYKEYKKQGLNPPQIVREASEQLEGLSGSDFDRFVTSCIVSRTNSRVTKDDFKRVYFDWCEKRGVNHETSQKVNKLLKERGFGRVRSNGVDYYTSMSLADLIGKDKLF